MAYLGQSCFFFFLPLSSPSPHTTFELTEIRGRTLLQVAQVGKIFPSVPRGMSDFGGSLAGAGIVGAEGRVRRTRGLACSFLTSSDGGMDKAEADLVRRLVEVAGTCSQRSATDERALREEEKRGGGGGGGGGVKVSGLGIEGVREVSSETISISVVNSISPSAGMSFAPARGTWSSSSSFSLSSLSASRATTVAYTPLRVLRSLILRGVCDGDSESEGSVSESVSSELEEESLGSMSSSSCSGA